MKFQNTNHSPITQFLIEKNFIQCVVILILLFFTAEVTQAQSLAARRYEIDAKRAGVSFTSKDALPRGREFKRIDSTYYVGWLLEGAYKYDHAADYLGFKAAATQLEKALMLMEKDFKTQLSTRTKDALTYIQGMKYHRDWDYGAYALMQCYSNIEEPDNVWKLLQKCKRLDLQDELYLDTYDYLAWTVHRNRFYTSRKYSFLKNSIDENEQYANKLLDSAALKIKRDAELNKIFFGENFEKEKMPAVWHYKSILYTYQLNIESGAYYYDKLKTTKYFPANNFATFCAIQADFAQAERFYDISKSENQDDKRLNESYYYLSIINTYKGECKIGIDALQSLIKANGSTPGFGWYNIALARDLIYDGQIEIAERYALKAAQFKEIHIGTTLGQSHYDFTTSLMNLIIKIREIEDVKFMNKNWWFNPSDISKIAKLTIEKYGLQFLIINQFSQNPERDRVIYKLFSTESTVSFDEIYQLIDGFSTNYFLNRFQNEIKNDKRNKVKKYYKLFVARLLIKKGKYKEAKNYLIEILDDKLTDYNYEKLLLFRTLESLIICNNELKETEANDNLKLRLYSLYPQIIPSTGIDIPMRIHTNATGEKQQKIIDKLQSANIHWITESTSKAIDVYLEFTERSNFSTIRINTKYNNESVVPQTEFSYSNVDEAAYNVCHYIFGIGNNDKDSSTGIKKLTQ